MNQAFGSGIGCAGHGLSPVYWAEVSKNLLNADNKNPTIIVKEEHRYERYFDKGVTRHVPKFFLINAVVMFVLGFVVVPFMVDSQGSMFMDFLRKIKSWIYKTEAVEIEAAKAGLPTPEINVAGPEVGDPNIDPKETPRVGERSPIELKTLHLADMPGLSPNRNKATTFNNTSVQSGPTLNLKAVTPRLDPKVLEEFQKNLDAVYHQKKCSFSFWIFFLFLTYVLGMPSFFLINIKNFGFEFYDDQTLTNVAIFGTVVAFSSRIGSGILIDKYGTVTIFKLMLV
jgi:hypothetical protein